MPRKLNPAPIPTSARLARRPTANAATPSTTRATPESADLPREMQEDIALLIADRLSLSTTKAQKRAP